MAVCMELRERIDDTAKPVIKALSFLFPENVLLKPDLDDSRSSSSMKDMNTLYDFYRDDFSVAKSQIQTE